ncbi:MAG: tetratricopeptide repeat protein [Sulfurovum sp.]|nr:tetratricopeptide repeat protein [Sulfurovum sp.]
MTNSLLKRYLSALLLTTLFLSAESSLFGFGPDEDVRKKTSNSSTMSFSSLNQKMMEQEERIDGLTTIIEGLSASLNTLQTQNIEKENSNTAETDILLKKLVVMIDEINSKYVSKEELKDFLIKFDKKNSVKKTKSEKKLKVKAEKSPSKLYSEGVRHFVKQRYNEARKRFTLTQSKNYKPAASNYYLGEIAYYTKNYEDAIFHYKKSAGLYDKASYIDTLLLHTAISLDKTGKKDQAKVFYENIIENYPEKKTAKIARRRVERL